MKPNVVSKSTTFSPFDHVCLSCFTGWLVKMKLKTPEELNELMDKTTYTAHCTESEE